MPAEYSELYPKETTSGKVWEKLKSFFGKKSEGLKEAGSETVSDDMLPSDTDDKNDDMSKKKEVPVDTNDNYQFPVKIRLHPVMWWAKH